MDASNFNLKDVVDKLIGELQGKGIPFEYVNSNSVGGSYSDQGNIKDGRKHVFEVSIEDEDEYIQGGQINEEKLMGLISTIFHEYRHIEQTEQYKYKPDFSKKSIDIAKMNAIQANGFSNYYFENYRQDPKEVDATIYGFEEALKFAKREFPGLDAEKGIVDYVNSYIEQDKYNEYGLHMFDEGKSNTIAEILGQLRGRILNPTRVPLSQVTNGFIEDDQLREVLTDEFIKRYESCSTVEEKDDLVFQEVVKLHPEILAEYPVLQTAEIQKDGDRQSITIGGKKVERKQEKGENFEKITRSLNGVEINSDKEFEDGSYDKRSRVFVADRGINVSSDYINYTSYSQQYDAKTNTYRDKSQSPIIDENGNVIGEEESIEIFKTETGERQVTTFSSLENENGIYQLEKKFDGKGDEYSENWSLAIDNKLSGSKETIQYINEDGKEIYIYMENGAIGQKVTKTDRGTTIDIYKDGRPDVTYEYDENGDALIQMAGIEKLPDDYVKSCFEIAIPEYELIVHQEPEEIYAIDEINNRQQDNPSQEVSTTRFGKETLDVQKDVERMDNVQNEMAEQMKDYTKANDEKEEKPRKEDDYVI